jgi:hypothetical protein
MSGCRGGEPDWADYYALRGNKRNASKYCLIYKESIVMTRRPGKDISSPSTVDAYVRYPFKIQ